MKIPKISLLAKVIISIVLALLVGDLLPALVVRLFVTFNGLFSNFLGFCVPLIILGLVAPSIADLGKNAGKLLALTVALAYGSTLLSGFSTYLTTSAIFPTLLGTDVISEVQSPEIGLLTPFFSVGMPPVFDVMTALILAFTLGIGIALFGGSTLKSGLAEFRVIIERLIVSIIIPLLPIYIFGIFLNIKHSGAAFQVILVFGKIIMVIFVLHVIFLLAVYCIAGLVGRKNPFKLLLTMMPAYMTALGTSSSAATIPVTLEQTKKNGVSPDVADFCIPLCATINLSGSMMKITATSLAICMMHGLPHEVGLYVGFILLLGIVMVAAPGVPGGAIMAAIGVLQTVLGFSPAEVGLMIALYIAIDSFGTACNVTGDGAIAVVIDSINKKFFKR